MIDEPIISFNLVENPIKNATANEKPQSVGNTEVDGPTITANDCMNGETSNDDCLSQSPLNLTRSRGLLSCIHSFINNMHKYMYCVYNMYTCITRCLTKVILSSTFP